MFNLVAREPWADDLLAIAERGEEALVEEARASAVDGRVGHVAGEIIPLLRQMCDLNLRETVRLREDFTRSDLAHRTLTASFQSFVNEARRGDTPLAAPLLPSVESRPLKKMNKLCERIERFALRYPGRAIPRETQEEWLEKLEEALLLELAKSPLTEKPVFDEERMGLFALTPVQACILRNEPMSSRLLTHYLALRRAHPDYEPGKVILEEIKGMFMGVEALEKATETYFKMVYETLLPIVARVADQVGERLLDEVWTRRTPIHERHVSFVHESNLSEKSRAHLMECRGIYRHISEWSLESQMSEIQLERRKKHFFLDLRLTLAQLLEQMKDKECPPLIYPDVVGKHDDEPIAFYGTMNCADFPLLSLAQSLGTGYFHRTFSLIKGEGDDKLRIYNHFTCGEETWRVFRYKFRLDTGVFAGGGIIPFKWESFRYDIDIRGLNVEQQALLDKVTGLRTWYLSLDESLSDFQMKVDDIKREWKKTPSVGIKLFEVKDYAWPKKEADYILNTSLLLNLKDKCAGRMVLTNIYEKVAVRDKLRTLRTEVEARLREDAEFQASMVKMDVAWRQITSIADYFLIEVEGATQVNEAFQLDTDPDKPLFSELEKVRYPTFKDRRFDL